MAKHVIYDFETLDNKPSSAVASIAVIVFDPSEMKSFEELVKSALRVKFKLKPQLGEMKRTFSAETVEWWKHPDQSEAYKNVIQPSDIDLPLEKFGTILKKYLDFMGYEPDNGEYIWTRGNSFDPPIMSDLFNQFGWDDLLPWWRVRDVRTEIDAITPYWDDDHKGHGYVNCFPMPEGFIKHVETHDCARDILMMQYTHLKLIEKMGE